MGKKLQSRLQLVGISVLYWFIVFMFYDVFRRMGISDDPGVVLLEETLTRLENLELTFIVGVITGIFYGIIEILVDNQYFKRKAIGLRIIIKSVGYFLLINMILFVGLDQLNRILETPLEYTYYQLMTSGAVWSLIIYFVVCSMLFSFFQLVNEKFGPGVLKDMLLGKYRNPRVEKKVFMFMDLKSSTTLAEKMGYLQYSSLIQQCFYDLNEVVLDHEGEIYQYVGDEAVISWDYKKGVKDNLCIDCYFAFRNKLYERKEFYEEKYGLLPEFKAGIHGGELVVTEVGVIKKEIAYHGDVINTTARIQEKCNSFDQELLVSGELVSDLDLANTYSPSFLGEIELKGKEALVHIHAIRSDLGTE